jgi:hypothetical protein
MDSNGNPVRLIHAMWIITLVVSTPIISEAPAPAAQIAVEERSVEPVIIQNKTRCSSNDLSSQRVIIAPQDQIQRINNNTGNATSTGNQIQ